MKKRIIAFFVLFLLCLPPFSYAHRVSVFAYQEGNTITVEGFFSDGTPTRHATIEVFDPNGKKIFSGKTNEKGTLSFKAPAASPLKIVLVASMGHRAETVFRMKNAGKATGKTKGEVTGAVPPETTQGAAAISEARLKAIVHDEVSQAIQPVMRALARQEAKRISFADIIGGIGWIMGLMGIWMMLKARKK